MEIIDWQKHSVLKIILLLEEQRLEGLCLINNIKSRNGELFALTNLIRMHQEHFAKVSVQNMSIVNSGFQETIQSDIH
jgi:hypothetical protein